jgi:predicted Zn-dependent protease
MPRDAASLAVLAAVAASAGLVARRAGHTTESLLPVLRAAEQQGRQVERVAGAALPVDPDEERRQGEALRSALPRDERSRGLEKLGRRLERTGLAPRYAGRYQYAIMPGSSPNAFSLPGGLIFVTEGLASRLGSDPDQLAFVLAHELAHSELGHTTDKVRYRSWMERFEVPGADLVQLLREVPAQAYSRTQELEADALALEMLRRADFRLTASLAALDAIEPAAPEPAEGHRDPASVLLEGLGDYFHSHPGLREREDQLRSLIAAAVR